VSAVPPTAEWVRESAVSPMSVVLAVALPLAMAGITAAWPVFAAGFVVVVVLNITFDVRLGATADRLTR